jgi:hypothetical protein
VASFAEIFCRNGIRFDRIGVDIYAARPGADPPAKSEHMGEIVKLGLLRKQAAQRAKQVRAAANRLASGRSKAERKLAEARAEKARRELDACRIETGEGQ